MCLYQLLLMFPGHNLTHLLHLHCRIVQSYNCSRYLNQFHFLFQLVGLVSSSILDIHILVHNKYIYFHIYFYIFILSSCNDVMLFSTIDCTSRSSQSMEYTPSNDIVHPHLSGGGRSA